MGSTGIVDRSSYWLLLNDEVHLNTTKPWSFYDLKSQQYFSGMLVLIGTNRL